MNLENLEDCLEVYEERNILLVTNDDIGIRIDFIQLNLCFSISKKGEVDIFKENSITVDETMSMFDVDISEGVAPTLFKLEKEFIEKSIVVYDEYEAINLIEEYALSYQEKYEKERKEEIDLKRRNNISRQEMTAIYQEIDSDNFVSREIVYPMFSKDSITAYKLGSVEVVGHFDMTNAEITENHIIVKSNKYEQLVFPRYQDIDKNEDDKIW